MKTMIGNGKVNNNPSGKHNSINSEATFSDKDDRGADEERFDRNCLSEYDLDRIMACI